MKIAILELLKNIKTLTDPKNNFMPTLFLSKPSDLL